MIREINVSTIHNYCQIGCENNANIIKTIYTGAEFMLTCWNKFSE